DADSNISKLFISKLMQDLESIDNKCGSHILNQAKEIFSDISVSINILIDKLIDLLIKTHDEGNNFDETKIFISQCIHFSNQSLNDIFEWLENNQTKSKYLFFLGYIQLNFNRDEAEAFSLFLKAAEDNYPIAQVYLSICYKEGFGITKDNQLAFTWLKKSVDNIDNIIYGQLNLGIYYENIDKNLKEAFNWYQQSADNGNSM
ncbi:6437_t:CDS:2, partial [Funneliformis geosporum]